LELEDWLATWLEVFCEMCSTSKDDLQVHLWDCESDGFVVDFLLGANKRRVLLSGQVKLGSNLTGVMIQVNWRVGGREGVAVANGEGECGAIFVSRCLFSDDRLNTTLPRHYLVEGLAPSP
jgi:hypothetical protein